MTLRVLVIGAGGTGIQLAPHLGKVLGNSEYDEIYVTVVDGKTIAARNVTRQHAISKVGSSKGAAWAEALEDNCVAELKIDVLEKFIETPTEIVDLVGDATDVLIYCCVDNNDSRILIEEGIEACQAANLLYLDGGNGDEENGPYQGQVNFFQRKDGKALGPMPSEINPDKAEPDKLHPTRVGCGEAGLSQLSLSNAAVALTMAVLTHHALEGDSVKVNEVCFDLRKPEFASFARAKMVLNREPTIT